MSSSIDARSDAFREFLIKTVGDGADVGSKAWRLRPRQREATMTQTHATDHTPQTPRGQAPSSLAARYASSFGTVSTMQPVSPRPSGTQPVPSEPVISERGPVSQSPMPPAQPMPAPPAPVPVSQSPMPPAPMASAVAMPMRERRAEDQEPSIPSDDAWDAIAAERNRPNERLFPGVYWGGLAGVGIVAALIGTISALVQAQVTGVLICLVVGAALASTLGVVELTPESVTVRKLIGSKTISYFDIVDVGMGARRVKTTKWYLPVLTLRTGKPVKLTVLQSVSKKQCHKSCAAIVAMTSETNKMIDEEREEALVSDAPLFVPLPGLEHHYPGNR